MNAALQKLVTSALGVARGLINSDKQEELTPVFIELTPDNKIDILMVPFGDGDQKDFIAAMLRAKFKKDRAVAYIHVSEAWMLDYPANALKSEMMRPSKSERRKEVVIVCGQHIDGSCIMQMAEILRDDNNKRSLGEPNAPTEITSLGGRFGTLLSED